MQNLLQLSKPCFGACRADDVMIGVLEANGSVHADVATADHSKTHAYHPISQALLTALDLRSVQRCLPFGSCVRGC